MEKTSDMMFKYAFKRIIYFNSDFKDVIIETIKVIKDQILTVNSSDTFECVVYMNSIRINCDDEYVIKLFERFLISKLPDNILIYPHYTVNLVNFEDIREFQTRTDLPLGRFIYQAIQVLIILFNRSVIWY